MVDSKQNVGAVPQIAQLGSEKDKQAPEKSTPTLNKDKSALDKDNADSLCSEGCPCLPKNWKLSPCVLIWMIVYIITMVMFLAGFIAPYWRDDDDVTHSGLWKICAYDICYNFVGDSRIPKDDSLKATQAMMILALLAAILGGFGHVGWFIQPRSPLYRTYAWGGTLACGVVGAIGVLVYGVWVGHRPEGWAYWLSVASSVMMFLLGLITSCDWRTMEDDVY